VLSVVFAIGAAVALAATAATGGAWRISLLLAAAAFIQLRLLCNLFDGMMALEGGLRSPVGDIYNDLPDRIADPVILVAAGCAVRHLDYGLTLGWVAALLAVITAYVRMLGAASGQPHDYRGPMAKQHRMAVMTFACAASVFDPLWQGWAAGQIIRGALAAVVVGCVVTIVRRLAHMSKLLRMRKEHAS